MPATYAHYRFGASMLEVMPGDIRRTVKRYRHLYDVGLHGPDLFFYYPKLPAKGGSLGSRIHHMTGREFFGRVCRGLRLDPVPGAEAYLYGVLSHYALDMVCHPFIWEQDQKGVAKHIEIETEFDRFLLELDGKVPPERQDLSNHMQLNRRECATVARFYPETTDKMIAVCVRNMNLFAKTMALGKGRDLMKKGLGLADKRFEGFVMTQGPNPTCAHLDQPLLALYEKAAERFSEMVTQLGAHMTYNAPLGEDFSEEFG